MAKDPAFLFYPGDYLRDTQNFTEAQQVAYDRIMCEHMRNICITQMQLDFFTKRISETEKAELMFYLKKVNGGYQIEWVAESIIKRRAYTESRRNNKGKKDKSVCSTYDSHMENENENEIINKDVYIISNILLGEIRKRKPDFKQPNIEKWAAEVDLMLRIDNRDVEQIKEVILWCQEDDFWKNNILSTAKLRKQYDQLVLKMLQNKKPEKKSRWS